MLNVLLIPGTRSLELQLENNRIAESSNFPSTLSSIFQAREACQVSTILDDNSWLL